MELTSSHVTQPQFVQKVPNPNAIPDPNPNHNPNSKVQDFTAMTHARQGELKKAFVFDYGPETSYCRSIEDVGEALA